MNRREFLKQGAGAVVMTALAPHVIAAAEVKTEAASKRPIRKAIMWGTLGVKGSPIRAGVNR